MSLPLVVCRAPKALADLDGKRSRAIDLAVIGSRFKVLVAAQVTEACVVDRRADSETIATTLLLR